MYAAVADHADHYPAVRHDRDPHDRIEAIRFERELTSSNAVHRQRSFARDRACEMPRTFALCGDLLYDGKRAPTFPDIGAKQRVLETDLRVDRSHPFLGLAHVNFRLAGHFH